MIGSNIRGLGKREETEIKIKKKRQANKKERKELNGNYYYFKRLDGDINKIHFKLVNF